ERQMRRGAKYIEKIAESIEEAARERGPLTEEERIRRHVEQKFKKRQEMVINFVSFILVNTMLWAIYAFSNDIPQALAAGTAIDWGFPWPIFPTLGWAIGVVAQYMEYQDKFGTGADRREEAIQREIERERARSAAFEKPKNDRRMRLTEDGELEEVPDDEISEAEKRKRGR
ncbi:MAG: 2TM domain-containing protein, partial [Anaerolineae bacterium]|nr:2TM domain-containing protein [Anaerolineae bacterium]